MRLTVLFPGAFMALSFAWATNLEVQRRKERENERERETAGFKRHEVHALLALSGCGHVFWCAGS